MGQTDLNFWQIEIIILISHKKVLFFIVLLFCFYVKINKKQKSSALGIAESRSKEIRLLSYVTCVDFCYNHFELANQTKHVSLPRS